MLYPSEKYGHVSALAEVLDGPRINVQPVIRGGAAAHPDLDYNLEHPHYNSTAPLQQAGIRKSQAISQLASSTACSISTGAVTRLMRRWRAWSRILPAVHMSLIPVSVDGTVSPQVPDSRPDTGQSAEWASAISRHSTLLTRATKDYRPLAYGFMTQDDLAKRFLNVATGFRPNF
jgi:conjugal transfer pilus assembly protein TraF